MPEEARLVYQIAIVLALIIFICSIPSVCAGEVNQSNISATSNETDLNETVTESPTETIPVEPTVQTTEEITTEPTILTPVTTLTDAMPVQTTDTAPVVDAQKKSISQKSINHIQIHLGKQNITNDIARDISLKSELMAYGIENSEKLLVPSPGRVSRYDFVTVDTKLLRELVKAGKSITISIEGTDYPAELSRMDFENLDDGVDSFHGSLTGIKNSDMLFTASDKALIGRITFENDTYWITPAESRQNAETSQSPLHFIYNSGDVTDKQIKIDDGPATLPEKTTELSDMGVSGFHQTKASILEKTPLSQTVTVNILIVTDEAFYNNSYWIPFAQNIIAEANTAFGTSDINVHLNPIYDDSRRSQFSGDPDVTNLPLDVLKKVYTYPILNATNADIVLYLGGYNVNGDAQGLSWGYGALFTQPDKVRYAWAQMVGDDPYPFYFGTSYGQSVISIHEIGHLFGACHQNQGGCAPYAHAYHLYPSTKNTVMWDSYNEYFSLPIFSSEVQNYQGLSLGSPTKDNSRNISETRDTVAGYANCYGIFAPTAAYSWNPTSVPVGQEIIFHDDSGNLPITWSWDFGDGNTSNLQNPSYTYSKAAPTGTYKVRLTATNCAGFTTAEHDIIVVSKPYCPVFSGAPTNGSAPLVVQFIYNSTPRPERCNWSFGDGDYSEVLNPQHTYNESGSFTINLTVIRDGVSNTTIKENYITVAPHAPDASFTSFIKSGSAPLFIQFNDTSINNPTRWNWNFDYGTTFNTTSPLQKNASHTFTTAGTYNVTLTAENTLGSSATSQQVTATNIPPPTNTNPFEKTSPGSYTYTSPVGMNSLTMTIVGAGGGGGGGTYDSVSSTGNGGYGGNASQVKIITRRVSPGSTIPVYIGSKGSGGNGQCGQINGNPGSDGGFSSVGNILAMGGPGGTGGIYSPISSHWNGYVGQDGYGTGQYATSGSSSGEFIGGTGGIGRGGGGGGASVTCTGTGGYGADGYIWIQPNFIPPPLANFTASQRSGPTPLTIHFNDTTTGNPTGWSWDFGDGNTTNATVQNPVHTYFENGTYTVTLTAMNTVGYNTKTKRNAVCAGGCRDDIGVYQDGTWQIDYNGNFAWDGGIDQSLNFGSPGDSLVYGDWNGNTRTKIGVFNNGSWLIDYNGNSVYDGPVIDRTASFGSPGQNPIVGDWNGDHKDEIGTEKDGFWTIDYNGNFAWDGAVTDRFAAFGQADDNPVVGDWNGDGRTKIGSEKDGFWSVDYNGNYVWDYPLDKFAGFGQANDKPVVGDWNGDHNDKIGSQKDGFWALDYNGNFVWDGEVTDRFAGLGQANDLPVTGDWNSDGSDEIGSFVNGFWAIDYNGNYQWDGVMADRFAAFGGTGALPVVGKW